MSGLFATLPTGLLAQRETFWFPQQASTTAFHVDTTFDLIYWICIVFTVIVMVPLFVFPFVYRRKEGVPTEHSPHHSTVLEVTWSVIPSLLIVVIFVKGFAGYLDMRDPPPDTYDIYVIAKKWGWTFQYPNGASTADLHVPADTPVKLLMQSDDVIHSLYIPAFRAKHDIVPGRVAEMWFEAVMPEPEEGAELPDGVAVRGQSPLSTETAIEDGVILPDGTVRYDLFCTEYCGTGHAYMIAKVVVHPADQFDDWLESEYQKRFEMPPIELGKQLYVEKACAGCHSIDGSKKQGPSFMMTYGNEHRFTNADPVTGDEAYIRESIEYPMAKIREGYAPVMPSYKGQLASVELNALFLYIKSLNPAFSSEAEADNERIMEEREKAKAEEAEAVPEA
ncbi:MAG: c-type cytochrome [Planctomycetota bacterium]